MIYVDEQLKENIGMRLKSLRKKNKLTIENLANILSKEYYSTINEKTIRRYEKGKFIPEIDNLILLSQYYNVSLDYIIFGKETSDDNSYTWYDSFKRLSRLLFSTVLIPWKIDDISSPYYGKYYFTAFDKEMDIFMDKLYSFAKEWDYSFKKTGEIIKIDVHTFDEILKPTCEIKDDLTPSLNRLYKTYTEYKQDPNEYINNVIKIILEHSKEIND